MEYLVVVSKEKPGSWRADILLNEIKVGHTAFNPTQGAALKSGVAMANRAARNHPGKTVVISSNVSKIKTTVSVPPLALCPE